MVITICSELTDDTVSLTFQNLGWNVNLGQNFYDLESAVIFWDKSLATDEKRLECPSSKISVQTNIIAVVRSSRQDWTLIENNNFYFYRFSYEWSFYTNFTLKIWHYFNTFRFYLKNIHSSKSILDLRKKLIKMEYKFKSDSLKLFILVASFIVDNVKKP